ncbi:hypothetical protein DENSPDRAFT_843406 [Dentipellis sp. KUC8613]|nr:hypothetical protein DENSPDRAFT_843406 [Dentipellis sp. KUC8613]
MLRRHFQYSSVLQEDYDEGREDNARAMPVARWCFVVILLCSIVDIVALLYSNFWPMLAQTPSNVFEDLPLRSSYLRLDELYGQKHQPSTPHGPVINFPRAFGKVSASDIHRTFPQWPIWWGGESGFVPFADLQVLVNSEMSTIAQFHVMDYGMENCSLTFRTPSATDAASLPGVNLTLIGTDGQNSTEIGIWLLKTTSKIDLGRLSWANKPPRDRYLGSMLLSPGTTARLPGISCRSGSYLAFEVTCKSLRCLVDIAVPIKKILGLYLRQYQTI